MSFFSIVSIFIFLFSINYKNLFARVDSYFQISALKHCDFLSNVSTCDHQRFVNGLVLYVISVAQSHFVFTSADLCLLLSFQTQKKWQLRIDICRHIQTVHAMTLELADNSCNAFTVSTYVSAGEYIYNFSKLKLITTKLQNSNDTCMA